MPTPRFRASFTLEGDAATERAWFAFRGAELLVRASATADRFEIPVASDLALLGVPPARVQPLGALDERPCCSAELADDASAREGYAFVSLRQLYGRIEPELFELAGTAFQVQYWDKTHQYCAACGAPLEGREGVRAKRCARCQSEYFPRISPATIALIEDGPRILMTRHSRLPAGMYALVAGFVEPGETLEECVAREAREETGVEVTDLTYFGSQPWPFPHQIMIGFTARYAGGEVRVDTQELEDARWFSIDALPLLPPPLSIARRLIDAWIARARR
jgi:NAD+ diphosphatase